MVGLAIGPQLSDDARLGLRALVVAPALLFAPLLAGGIGGRADRAGALTIGTLAVAFLLNTTGGAPFAELQNAFLAFLVGAGIIATVPMLPEGARRLADVAGSAAFGLLVLVAVAYGATSLDPIGLAAGALLFVTTAGTAAIVARAVGVEVPSALAGAGTRDFAVAAGLAVSAGGPGSVVAPLGFGVAVGAVSLLLARNRRKAR